MAPNTSTNNASSGSNNNRALTDVGFEVDRYMAAVDYIMANSTSSPQICPFHKRLLDQTKSDKQVDYHVLMAWIKEKGYEESVIIGFEDEECLSISKPCTCAAIVEALMRATRG